MNAVRSPLDDSSLAAQKRTRSIRVLLAAALSLNSALAYGEDILEKQQYFTISAQPLDTALLEFSKQAHVQVMVDAQTLRGYVTSGITGTEAAKTALSKLLGDSGLTFVVVGNAVQVLPLARTLRRDVGRSESTMLLARLDQAEPAESSILSTQERMLSDGNEHTKGRPDVMDEVVVTGTHIRGLENRTAPLTVIGQDQIIRSGYSNTQELIRSLSQNFTGGQAGASEDGVFGNGGSAALNYTAATGINLRGLGTSSTLVLLNGHRMAPSAFGSFVDISLVPLSAVERVEILADGSSAIYGADAVGGVVNFVLKEDYEGAETSVRYGSVDKGGRNETTISQIFGGGWTSGNAVATLQYQRQSSLRSIDRSFASQLTEPNELLPNTNSYSAMLNARQSLSNSVGLHFDGLVSRREVDRITSDLTEGGQSTDSSSRSDSVNVNAGVRYEFARDWSINASVQLSDLSTVQSLQKDSVASGTQFSTFDGDFSYRSADLTINGRAFMLPAGPVNLAIGASYRDEDLNQYDEFFFGGFEDLDVERHVGAIFGEAYIPLIGAAGNIPLIKALDISVAMRYDDYSDFGSTMNPRFGVFWSPWDSIHARAVYSESFRAPNTLERAAGERRAIGTSRLLAPSGAGVVPVFIERGSEAIGAERARNMAYSIEFRPKRLAGSSVGIAYYDIEYQDRIIRPPFDSTALTQPSVFGALITPLASDIEAQAFLSNAIAAGAQFSDRLGTGATGVRHVLNLRQQNASLVKQTGVDLFARYVRPLPGSGTFSTSLNASFLDRIDTVLAEGATPTDLVDTFGNPVSWKARLDAGWTNNSWLFNVAANYVGDYVNTSDIDTPPVGAWTTIDLVGRWNLETAFPRVIGSSLTLSVLNAFDRAPPFISAPSRMLVNYDPANASPLGRYISLELRMQW